MKVISFTGSVFSYIYEKRNEIILLLFVAAIAGIGLVLFSLEARGQSKFYSFPNRGSAEGAKGNAILQTLLNENAARVSEIADNAASITALRAATEASLTVIGDCGSQGMIFGPAHPTANADDCIPSVKVENDGRVSLQGGMTFGNYALCASTTAGTLRYNATAKRMEFCNGSIWGMLGGNVGCSINFTAVTNADLDTYYDTTDAVYSGETATASVAGATRATVRRNGANTGMSSGVTINQGNSVGIRGRSASLFNQTANFTLDIGAYTACWQITTKQQDVTPDSFSFTALTNQELSTLVTSNSVTVNGFDGPLTVSVTGQGSPQIRIGSGSWATSGNINPGQSLAVRLTTSSSNSTAHIATVTLGTFSTDWSATTKAACSCPGVFVSGRGYSVSSIQPAMQGRTGAAYNHCLAMGGSWALPTSTAVLQQIRNDGPALGMSFPSNYFWTSNGSGCAHIWTTHMGSGADACFEGYESFPFVCIHPCGC